MVHFKLIFLFLLILSFVSCRKNEPFVDAKKVIDPSKVAKLPTTEEEKKLVKNLEKITSIFKSLYKEKKNISLVNIAVMSKVYHDEGILLKDLIYPNSSRLKNNQRFNAKVPVIGYSLQDFSNTFWQLVNSTNDSDFMAFLQSLASSNASRNTNENGPDVSVYFPYSELFVAEPNGATISYGTITSLVTATADADEGWGSLPVYTNGVLTGYTQVLVNDDYCINNPTHIIGVVGLNEATSTNGVDSVPPPPSPPPGISRLYIGEGRCRQQFDKMISFTGNGGGSEIKYCHMTAYLQPVNGHVTSFQDIISVNFHRATIRFGLWQRAYVIWDDDWIPGDLEQFLGIYEEDNTNDKSFTGSVGTTLKIDSNTTVTGNIGFAISIKSQDDIIRQLKISRNSYFTGAFQDQGWGRRNDFTFIPPPHILGWPKYDGGAAVSWTWPYKTN